MPRKPTYEELEQKNKELEKEVLNCKRTEEALQESEKRFKNVTNSIGELLVLLDQNFKVQLINSTLAQAYNVSLDEYAGKHCYELFYGRNDICEGCPVMKVFNDGKVTSGALRYRPDGRIFDRIAYPLIEDNGNITGVIVIGCDITQQKQAEEKLREGEELINKREDNTLLDFVLDQLKEPKAFLSKVQALYKTSDEDFDVLNFKDGRVFERYSSPLIRDRQITARVWSFRDITDRKRAEEALRKKTHDLDERVKELSCLYGIGSLVERQDISLEEIFQEIVDLIVPSWQYPEITCARIITQDREWKTKNFRETIWKQASDIKVHGELIGNLEVYYLEEKPEIDEGSFLIEERYLINTITRLTGRIVERKQAEEALRASEEKYRNIFENIQDVYYEATLDGIILEISPSIKDVSLYKREEFIGKLFSDIYVDPKKRDEFLKELLKNGKVTDYEILIKDKDGSQSYCSITAKLASDKHGKPVKIIGSMHNINEQKRDEEQIHSLTHNLMKAQENERQRISCYLHDNMAQNLSGLIIDCETLLDNQPSIRPEIRQKVSEMSKTLRECIKEVRDLSYDLRPPILDDLGLVQALFRCCHDFSEKNGINVDFHSAGMNVLRLDFDTEINLYRMTQEGLANIKKHADADRVTVKLVSALPNIILRIEDNGKGFDVQKRLATITKEKRMGIHSMVQRAKLLQGEMEIQSRPMQGTKISIKLPYKDNKSSS